MVVEREKWGANRVKKEGIKPSFFDGKIFFDTVASVARHDGVVEGGTGFLPDLSDDFQTVRTRGLK